MICPLQRVVSSCPKIFNFFICWGNLTAVSLWFFAVNNYDLLLPRFFLPQRIWHSLQWVAFAFATHCWAFFSVMTCSFMLTVANENLIAVSSYCLFELVVVCCSKIPLAVANSYCLLLAVSFLKHLKCTQTNTKTIAIGTKHIKQH